MGENLKYWVALNQILIENLGALSRIVQRYPRIQEAFRSSSVAGLKACGLDEEKAEILTSAATLAAAEQEIEKVEQKKYTIVTLEDESYPDFLREIFDPPCVLYCAGDVGALNEASISIVGARKPTPYGRAVVEKLARDLASRGIVIVSGMARGIDSLAHWGALHKGRTAAVLGSGLDCVYPKENEKLCARIMEKGVVVTEYPLTSPPLGRHFPLRNRIISGLSLALVVIEAAAKSGSLISARLALEQNRDVMAVPGNVTSEMSRGTNWLIKRGAKLVEDWNDVVEELPSPFRERFSGEEIREAPVPQLNDREKLILACLKADAQMHVDELVVMTDFSVSEILSLLLDLELKGLAVQSAGKYFQRKL